MKTELQHLLIDIKAAAQLGNTEALWVALDSLFNRPEVLSNEQLDEIFVKNVLAPVGKAMAHPGLPAAEVAALSEAPNTAARAVTAACLATHYLSGRWSDLNLLDKLGKDDRPEVRQAMTLALQTGDASALAQRWAGAASPKLQAIAADLE